MTELILQMLMLLATPTDAAAAATTAAAAAAHAHTVAGAAQGRLQRKHVQHNHALTQAQHSIGSV